ncbi:MAG: hypothetical protein K2F87_00665 [Muribaculaceae bacterium]|nr:hypothetical protein [Muribaculaceae bacterium]
MYKTKHYHSSASGFMNLIGIFSLMAGLSILLSGCSGKGQGTVADTPKPETALSPDDIPAEEPADPELTAGGIGPVRIGLATDSIPSAVPGLYDAVMPEEGYESNTYVFMYDGSPLFTAFEFTPGTVDVISADSPEVAVIAPGEKTLRLGGTFTDVLELPGVEATWEESDGEGLWCWRWQGLWFVPDQSRLSEALSRELYRDAHVPAKSSFTPEVKIGYMGTGLPW